MFFIYFKYGNFAIFSYLKPTVLKYFSKMHNPPFIQDCEYINITLQLLQLLKTESMKTGLSLQSTCTSIFIPVLLKHTHKQLDRYTHTPNIKRSSSNGLPKPLVTTTCRQWRDSDSLQLSSNVFNLYRHNPPFHWCLNKGNQLKLMFNIRFAFALSIPIFLSWGVCILYSIYRTRRCHLATLNHISDQLLNKDQ